MNNNRENPDGAEDAIEPVELSSSCGAAARRWFSRLLKGQTLQFTGPHSPLPCYTYLLEVIAERIGANHIATYDPEVGFTVAEYNVDVDYRYDRHTDRQRVFGREERHNLYEPGYTLLIDYLDELPWDQIRALLELYGAVYGVTHPAAVTGVLCGGELSYRLLTDKVVQRKLGVETRETQWKHEMFHASGRTFGDDEGVIWAATQYHDLLVFRVAKGMPSRTPVKISLSSALVDLNNYGSIDGYAYAVGEYHKISSDSWFRNIIRTFFNYRAMISVKDHIGVYPTEGYVFVPKVMVEEAARLCGMMERTPALYSEVGNRLKNNFSQKRITASQSTINRALSVAVTLGFVAHIQLEIESVYPISRMTSTLNIHKRAMQFKAPYDWRWVQTILPLPLVGVGLAYVAKKKKLAFLGAGLLAMGTAASYYFSRDVPSLPRLGAEDFMQCYQQRTILNHGLIALPMPCNLPAIESDFTAFPEAHPAAFLGRSGDHANYINAMPDEHLFPHGTSRVGLQVLGPLFYELLPECPNSKSLHNLAIGMRARNVLNRPPAADTVHDAHGVILPHWNEAITIGQQLHDEIMAVHPIVTPVPLHEYLNHPGRKPARNAQYKREWLQATTTADRAFWRRHQGYLSSVKREKYYKLGMGIEKPVKIRNFNAPHAGVEGVVIGRFVEPYKEKVVQWCEQVQILLAVGWPPARINKWLTDNMAPNEADYYIVNIDYCTNEQTQGKGGLMLKREWIRHTGAFDYWEGEAIRVRGQNLAEYCFDTLNQATCYGRPIAKTALRCSVPETLRSGSAPTTYFNSMYSLIPIQKLRRRLNWDIKALVLGDDTLMMVRRDSIDEPELGMTVLEYITEVAQETGMIAEVTVRRHLSGGRFCSQRILPHTRGLALSPCIWKVLAGGSSFLANIQREIPEWRSIAKAKYAHLRNACNHIPVLRVYARLMSEAFADAEDIRTDPDLERIAEGLFKYKWWYEAPRLELDPGVWEYYDLLITPEVEASFEILLKAGLQLGTNFVCSWPVLQRLHEQNM